MSGSAKILVLCLSLFIGRIGFSQIAGNNCVNYDNRFPITTSTGVKHYWNPIWNFYNMRQRRISNIDIGGTGMWRGLVEYLPPSYFLAANATKRYPVIIYFHGGGSKGNGSALELCRIFKDRAGDSVTHKSVPGRVERSNYLFTQTYAGIKYEYLVISPQFTQYTRLIPGVPDKFPSAKEVEDVINYVVSRYRVDSRRIYLAGFSTGANMIIEYAGSSLARAKRVAAIMPVALCSQLGHINNSSRGIYAKYIGLAKLKTWFVFCEGDNCGAGPALNVPNKWVDSIRKVPGFYPPRYTRIRYIDPPTMYNCSDTLLHDAWSRAFDPAFRTSFAFTPTGTVGPNDGINLNMYEWFIRHVAPATTTSLASASSLETGFDEQGLRTTSVIISPNPVMSEITAYVSVHRPQKLTFVLTDLTGKVLRSVTGVYGLGSTEVKIRSSDLPKGVYMLKTSGEKFTSTQKVIKR